MYGFCRLFLDELPEFGMRVLELMRQPLEDKVVTINHASGKLTLCISISGTLLSPPVHEHVHLLRISLTFSHSQSKLNPC